MAFNIEWDQDGERLFETGVDRGVLYPKTGENGTYAAGVAWNGLTAVNESPSGAEPSDFWADNIKYATLMSNEEFGFTIEAYTYPDEFAVCDGSVEVNNKGLYLTQQPRKAFGFTYRTLIGNDEDGQEHGYKLHIVYNCMASATDKSHSTVNDSPDLVQFSWEVKTTPVVVSGYKPTAHLVIDSTKCASATLTEIEEKLYGTAATTGTNPTSAVPAELPTIDWIVAKFPAQN